MTTATLFPAESIKPYLFVWHGRKGPSVRRFVDPATFDAYIIQVRELMGSSKAVEWLNPHLAHGVLV